MAIAAYQPGSVVEIASVDLFHAAGANWANTPNITMAGYHTPLDNGGGVIYALGASGCSDNAGSVLKDSAGNCFYATAPVTNVMQWGARCDAQNIKSNVTLATSAPQVTVTTPLNSNLRDGTAKIAVTEAGPAFATFTSTILSTDPTGDLITTAANPTQSGSLFTSIKVNQIVAPDGSWLNLPITNIANDNGRVQITVASTASMTNGLSYKITGANMTIGGQASLINAVWVADITDSAHFDLVDSAWLSGDSYISGGQTNRASYGTGFKVGDTIVWSWDGVNPFDTTVVSKVTDSGINTNILGGTQGARMTNNIIRGSESVAALPLSTSGGGALNSVGALMQQGRVFQLWAGHDDGAALNNAFASTTYDLHKPGGTTCATTVPLALPPNNSVNCDRSASTDFVAIGDITGTNPSGTQYTVYRANAATNGGGINGCIVDGLKLSVAAGAVLGGQLSSYSNNSFVNGQTQDFLCGVPTGTGIQITQDKFYGNRFAFSQIEFPLVSQQTPTNILDIGTCSGNYFNNTELSGGITAWDDEAGFNTITGCEEQQQDPYNSTTGIILASHSILSNCLLKNISGSAIYTSKPSANITNNRIIPETAVITPTTYGIEIGVGSPPVQNTFIGGNEIPPNFGLPSDQYIHADAAIGSDNVICNNPGAALITCLNGNARKVNAGATDTLLLTDETINWASASTAVKSEIAPSCSSSPSSTAGISVSAYANNGGLVQLTVSSTSALVEGATYTVSNVNATSNDMWPIHIVDGSNVTLTGSQYYSGDSYGGSGGTIGAGSSGPNKTYFINDDNGSGGSFATHNLTLYLTSGTINGASTYVATKSFKMVCDGVSNYVAQ